MHLGCQVLQAEPTRAVLAVAAQGVGEGLAALEAALAVQCCHRGDQGVKVVVSHLVQSLRCLAHLSKRETCFLGVQEALMVLLLSSKKQERCSGPHGTRLLRTAMRQHGGPFEDHSLQPNYQTDLLRQNHARKRKSRYGFCGGLESIDKSSLCFEQQKRCGGDVAQS